MTTEPLSFAFEVTGLPGAQLEVIGARLDGNGTPIVDVQPDQWPGEDVGHQQVGDECIFQEHMWQDEVVPELFGGGWYSDLGDYVLVRQSDAHAWTEVWFEGRGWTRVGYARLSARRCG